MRGKDDRPLLPKCRLIPADPGARITEEWCLEHQRDHRRCRNEMAEIGRDGWVPQALVESRLIRAANAAGLGLLLADDEIRLIAQHYCDPAL